MEVIFVQQRLWLLGKTGNGIAQHKIAGSLQLNGTLNDHAVCDIWPNVLGVERVGVGYELIRFIIFKILRHDVIRK